MGEIMNKKFAHRVTKKDAEEAEKFLEDSTFTGNYDSMKRLENERVEKELEKIRRQELKKRMSNVTSNSLEEDLEEYRKIGVRNTEKLFDLLGDNFYFLEKGKKHYVVLSKLGVRENRHTNSDIVLGYICPFLPEYTTSLKKQPPSRGLIIPKNPYTATAYKSKYTSAIGLRFKCDVCGYHSYEIPAEEKKRK